MANLFNLLKPSAKLPRNGFDLSQRHLFTASAGELLPICPIDCVPGDHFEIDVLEMARTAPVHTDAFVRMKQHFEFYFVPYELLWSGFNQFVVQREDKWSTQLKYVSSAVPNVSLRNFLTQIWLMLQDNGWNYSIDQWLKLLDLLGYGSFYACNWGAISQTEFAASLDETLTDPDLKINLFRLLSYQKVFYDYYRNSVYDTKMYPYDLNGTTPIDYVYSFNLDYINSEQDMDIVRYGSPYIPFMLHPRYRQWKKDLFTGLYPDTQLGAVSTAPLVGEFELYASNMRDLPQTANGNTLLLASSQIDGRIAGGTSSGSSNPSPVKFSYWNQSGGIDVLQLLKANALQKWRQSSMLAGNRTKDAFDAHFGVQPRYHNDTRSQFIGAFDSYIGLNEVVSTSNANGALGDVGAHGVGVADGKIRFDCSDFGTLFCMYSVVPTAEYNAVGCDPNNFNIEHFDFFTPEFQNLGMEPVNSVYYNQMTGRIGSRIMGYAPRYYKYKAAVDKVHGEFMRQLSPQGGEGIFSIWATPRVSYVPASGVETPDWILQDFLYIKPSVLDTVFVQEYNGSQATDQFIINCNFDIKAVRNMSVLGLPQF